MSLPIRHIACSDNLDYQTKSASSWYIGAHSYYETVFFRSPCESEKGFEQIHSLVWEKQPSSLSFSPFIEGEALIGLEDGSGWTWNGFYNNRVIGNLWPALDEPRAIKCDYLNHPRLMIIMHTQGAFIRDVRMHRQPYFCKFIELPERPSDQHHTFHDPLHALCVNTENRMNIWLGSNDALLLYDMRFLKNPLLSWFHHKEDSPPCDLQTLHSTGSMEIVMGWDRGGDSLAWFLSPHSVTRTPVAIGSPYQFNSIPDESTRMSGFCTWFDSQHQQLVLCRLFESASIYLDSYYLNPSDEMTSPNLCSSSVMGTHHMSSCLDGYRLENHSFIDLASDLIKSDKSIKTPLLHGKELKRHQKTHLQPLFDTLKMELYEEGHSMDVLDWDDFVNWLRNASTEQLWTQRSYMSTLDLLLAYNRQAERPLIIDEFNLRTLNEKIRTDETLFDLIEPCDSLCELRFPLNMMRENDESETLSNDLLDITSSLTLFRAKSLPQSRVPVLKLPPPSPYIRQFDSLWHHSNLGRHPIVASSSTTIQEYEDRESRHLNPSYASEISTDNVVTIPVSESSILMDSSISDYRRLGRLMNDEIMTVQSPQEDTIMVPTIRTVSTPHLTPIREEASSSSVMHPSTNISTIQKKKPRRSGF